MKEVEKLIKEVLAKPSTKKTKNKDLFLKTIAAIANDDEYVATYIESIESTGEIVTKNDKLAPKFRKMVARFIKQCTSLSQEEAEEAAKKIRLTHDEANVLFDIVSNGIYVNIKDLGKKVQLFNKPDATVTLSFTDVKETVRNNPRDDTKQTVIAARKKVKVEQKIYPFQKTTRIRKK